MTNSPTSTPSPGRAKMRSTLLPREPWNQEPHYPELRFRRVEFDSSVLKENMVQLERDTGEQSAQGSVIQEQSETPELGLERGALF